MEPQGTTIDSPPRTRRPIAALGPEEDHSRSGRSNGWAECREKKIDVQSTGRFFLLTFLFIGLVRLGRLPGPAGIVAILTASQPWVPCYSLCLRCASVSSIRAARTSLSGIFSIL